MKKVDNNINIVFGFIIITVLIIGLLVACNYTKNNKKETTTTTTTTMTTMTTTTTKPTKEEPIIIKEKKNTKKNIKKKNKATKEIETVDNNDVVTTTTPQVLNNNQSSDSDTTATGDSTTTTTTTTTIALNRMIVESDTSFDSDWDYNDLVMDIDKIDDDTINVTIVAVGINKPIRLFGNTEAHQLYGVDTSLFINTSAQTNGITKTNLVTIQKNLTGIGTDYSKIKIEVYDNDTWIEIPHSKTSRYNIVYANNSFFYCTEGQDIRTRYPAIHLDQTNIIQ